MWGAQAERSCKWLHVFSLLSASPRGTSRRVSVKQNSLFPLGPVIKCFQYFKTQTWEGDVLLCCEYNSRYLLLVTQDTVTHLKDFKEGRLMFDICKIHYHDDWHKFSFPIIQMITEDSNFRFIKMEILSMSAQRFSQSRTPWLILGSRSQIDSLCMQISLSCFLYLSFTRLALLKSQLSL